MPQRIRRQDSTVPSLLRFCRDEIVKVELKNGTVVEGTLSSIAANSNLTIVVPPTSDPPTSEPTTIHVRGTTVRYLIFTTSDFITRLVNVGKERSKVDEKRRGRNKFKRQKK